MPTKTRQTVPFFDLGRARDRIRPQLLERWERLLDTTAFVAGTEASAFEETFSRFLGTRGAVGVANGTDALVVALRALDLRPGDEVIVPAFTFIATAASVVLAGGRPVFADVDPETFNLDPRSAAERVTERTVGVIGVHLYGRPFDVDGVRALCERHGLWMMEDAAQAQGAAWKGRRVGGFGELATWSFYPSKNLGAFGDAGAITGNDPALLERARRIANHGRAEHLLHTEVGTNSRLDGLQAAVLLCRLEHLEGDNQRRRQIARTYQGALADVPEVRLPVDRDEAHAVYHQYAIFTPRRERLKEYLAERGVGTALFYPTPLHHQPALADYAPEDPEALPGATRAAAEVLCLPIFPELTEDEQGWVVDALEGARKSLS